jgi:SAM-dependent methyltransferase
MFALEKKGYEFDDVHRIWVRPGFEGIAYNDGDGFERRVADIVRDAGDVGVFSCELSRGCTDWVTLYHLSPHRGNVLRPFEDLLKGRVLEIGAGCGAISRYLGEVGGGLLALEGSPRRAAIAASRTRGLPNVTVLAERFDDFRCEERFDAITLIGVLEYAGVFGCGQDPALQMLRKARSMLNPNGRLFIAIENQLGLKYFAGAPEDHIGKPMYGIEGRYRDRQPRTYGRRALEALISAAGFVRCDFLAPFPDYKLPRSILTEQGCAAKDFDAAAFAWQSIAADPHRLRPNTFDIARTWRTVFENGLGLELSNSFIAVASPTMQPAVPWQTLAFNYSTGRKAHFCKETRFVRETQRDITVRYRLLADRGEMDGPGYELVLPSHDVYRRGRLLSETFVNLFSTPGWTIAQGGWLIRNYMNHLQTLLTTHGYGETRLDRLRCDLPGCFVDAIPQNIVIDSEGDPHLIDMEWRAHREIELGFLIFHGVSLLRSFLRPLQEAPDISYKELFERLFAAAGIPAELNDVARYSAQAVQLQFEVTGVG